jgi:hypothetical protein
MDHIDCDGYAPERGAVTLRAHARLNFGQPQARVFQMAYVVPDIEVGMRQWIDQLGVGPWFLHPPFR